MTDDADVQDKLRRWRLEHRLTLQELADLTGFSESMVSRVERGERRLNALDKVAIARRLGVRVSDLFDPEDPPRRSPGARPAHARP